MKRYLVKDLNDETKLKVEDRNSPQGTIAEIDSSIENGDLDAVSLENFDDNGVTRKRVVIDDAALADLKEQRRLKKIEEEQLAKSEFQERRQLKRGRQAVRDATTLEELKPVILGILKHL